MKNSAESRLGYCDFKTSCYSFGQVASNLLVVSLKRGNNYYNALEARCYNGDLQFLEEEKQVKAGQVVMAVIFIIILLLIWFLQSNLEDSVQISCMCYLRFEKF